MDQRGWRIIIFSSIALLVAAACYPAIYSVYSSAAGDGARAIYSYCTSTGRSAAYHAITQREYARETLDRYFADDLYCRERLAIQSVDYQKDKAMADKYHVNMQGLKMVTTKNGQETVKDVPEVWALVRDKGSLHKLPERRARQRYGDSRMDLVWGRGP